MRRGPFPRSGRRSRIAFSERSSYISIPTNRINLKSTQFQHIKGLPNYSNDIVLIQQFHIPKDTPRAKEIQDTLIKNSNNPYIKTIYLLNERIYTPKELGFDSIPNKIKQINIKERLTYYRTFYHIVTNIEFKDKWIILSNNDIFYDSSIIRIPELLRRKSEYERPKIMCLRRWELTKQLQDYFDKNYHSSTQDSWIFYSNECPNDTEQTKFHLGVPGCDNRIAYVLLKEQQYHLLNPQSIVKSYHNHKSDIRYYLHNKTVIPGPYHFIKPT